MAAIVVALVFGFVPHPARWVLKGLALLGIAAGLVLLLSVSLSTGNAQGNEGAGAGGFAQPACWTT